MEKEKPIKMSGLKLIKAANFFSVLASLCLFMLVGVNAAPTTSSGSNVSETAATTLSTTASHLRLTSTTSTPMLGQKNHVISTTPRLSQKVPFAVTTPKPNQIPATDLASRPLLPEASVGKAIIFSGICGSDGCIVKGDIIDNFLIPNLSDVDI